MGSLRITTSDKRPSVMPEIREIQPTMAIVKPKEDFEEIHEISQAEFYGLPAEIQTTNERQPDGSFEVPEYAMHILRKVRLVLYHFRAGDNFNRVYYCLRGNLRDLEANAMTVDDLGNFHQIVRANIQDLGDRFCDLEDQFSDFVDLVNTYFDCETAREVAEDILQSIEELKGPIARHKRLMIGFKGSMQMWDDAIRRLEQEKWEAGVGPVPAW